MKSAELKSDASSKVLNPTVLKLGAVSFFADIASEMLYPITPLFLTQILGATMFQLGLAEGVAEALASLLKTYSGAWSDRISKRKPFIFLGYVLSAIAKPLIGFSLSWIHVLLARSLDRTGKGLRTAPRDALISDSVEAKSLGRAFGWHRLMDTLGATIGPLIALLLLSQNWTDYRSLYFWSILPGLFSVGFVLSVREKSAPASNSARWINPLLHWRSCSAEFKIFILSWGIFCLINSSDVFLLMKARSSGLSTPAVILLYCGYNLIYALSSPYLGGLSDRVSRKNVIVFGLILFSAVYWGFGFATELWHFITLFVVYGLYMGATDGVTKAYIIDLSPTDTKATAIGILGTVSGLATIIASALAGLLWDVSGSESTFMISGAGAAIVAGLVYLQSRPTRPTALSSLS